MRNVSKNVQICLKERIVFTYITRITVRASALYSRYANTRAFTQK